MSLLNADVISRKTADYTESDIATGQKLLSDDIRPNGQNKSSRKNARKMRTGEGEVRQKVG